ncbi:MAG: serine O-acetyltransferase [Magnetococcales bacterium]|nr:serine O-acetyltransferase [Magnetococcales bacterium]
MFTRIRNDIQVVFDRDPAARTVLEILLCYPGMHALLVYRLAHWFWGHHLKLLARLFSYLGRMLTGIEIHPGARIGAGFFIDHGMGVVIGETTEIGANVTIYHGVTLGGTSWRKGKRHPTLGDNVIVGAGAKILGPVTIGNNARIGSNAVVVSDVPHDVTVVGVPGRVVIGNRKGKEKGGAMFPAYGQLENMPDPVVRAITCVLEQMHHLDDRLEALEGREKARETAYPSDERVMPADGSEIRVAAGGVHRGSNVEGIQAAAPPTATGKKGVVDCLQGHARVAKGKSKSEGTQEKEEMQGGCGP